MLGCSGIAKTAASDRNAAFSCEGLDRFVVDELPVSPQIESDRRATREGVGGPVNPDPVSQFSEAFEKRNRQPTHVF